MGYTNDVRKYVNVRAVLVKDEKIKHIYKFRDCLENELPEILKKQMVKSKLICMDEAENFEINQD